MRKRPGVLSTDTIVAIDEQTLARMASELTQQRVDAAAALLPREIDPGLPLDVVDGVAVIELSGPMSKHMDMVSVLYGGVSTLRAQEAFEMAVDDSDIRGVVLAIDSPGGSVSGLAEFADTIHAARGKKPIVAQVFGLCASAAYYAASQADAIYAHRADLVGSIGTRMLLYDWSRLFENAGVKAIPITTGVHKAAGALGTQVTEEQQAEFQRIVDFYFNDFLEVIRRGRGIDADALKSVADGRVFPAPQAVELGLIDGVQTYEQTLAELQAKTRVRPTGGRQQKESKMSQTVETQPATLAQLKQAFPNAGPEFRERCLESGMTLEQATKALLEQTQAELARVTQERDEARREAEESEAVAKTPDGVEPLGVRKEAKTSDAGGDPIAQWDEAVAEQCKAGKSKREAIAAVAKSDPELRDAYLDAYNGRHAAPRPGRRR